MAKEEGVTVDALITDSLCGDKFKAELGNGVEVLAHLSGKVRKNHIRVLVGDKVSIELSPYDLKRGRIVYRYK